ncbi:MAG: heavy metal translocating P-type ATPase [Clostridiales bacterium]|jgi:Cd2+/Zn2+-exporting ATPase|nr:heavy metal translocating P-type ATPase [Clostridiales bacterium]
MKKSIIRILISAAVFTLALIIGADGATGFWLFLAAALVIGGDVLYRAVKNIFKGKIIDENFLMSIAAVGAFCIGEYPEAVAVMLFYQVGEMFQNFAVDKSKKSIAALMNIRPDYANLLKDGKVERTDPNEVKKDDFILISPGEKVPLDAVVTEGCSTVDTAALTGESAPRDVFAGSEILGGFVNINGVITARVTKEYGESTVSKILDLVENASAKKSNSEKFITKFARYYTPIVVIAAIALTVVPTLILGFSEFEKWLYRALSFLVVSCPCALVISVPMSFFGGIGGASRQGILIKGGNYIEALARIETAAFDKTGTLTKGILKVTDVKALGIEKKRLLWLAAHAEYYSNHPAARAIRDEYAIEKNDMELSAIHNTEELAGYGVRAEVDGHIVCVGNAKLMEKAGADISVTKEILDGKAGGIAVHISVDGVYAGFISISDEIKDDAKRAISEIKAAGVKRIVMLTGDAENEARKVAENLGIEEYYCGLLPADKVRITQELSKDTSSKGKLVFVGDGINDAPVLAGADVGIAMGALGSDAAVEAADIVIMTDEPSKVAVAIRISKKTLKIARQNIIFALGVKLAALLLSAFGITGMWLAVFADVGVAVLAIFNALRLITGKDVFN